MILALDPSLSSTGYAIIDSDKNILDVGKIIGNQKKSEEVRMYEIANDIRNLIEKWKVKKVVMESQFAFKNIKTVMQLSRLRGAIVYVCVPTEVEMFYLAPTEVRRFFMGKGTAKKKEVAEHIRENYMDLGEFDDSYKKKKNSDMYDSIAIAIAFLNKGEE